MRRFILGTIALLIFAPMSILAAEPKSPATYEPPEAAKAESRRQTTENATGATPKGEQEQQHLLQRFWDFTLTDSLIATFTVVLAGVGWLQWNVLRKSVGIARESADVARAAAEALPKLERASVYVWVRLLGPVVVIPETSSVEMGFENHGRTAAVIRRICFNVTIVKTYPPPKQVGGNMLNASSAGIIPVTSKPSQPDVKVSTQFKVGREEFEAIKRGDLMLICVGRIEYGDVFGNWETGWCWKYLPYGDTPGFIVADRNDLNYRT